MVKADRDPELEAWEDEVGMQWTTIQKQGYVEVYPFIRSPDACFYCEEGTCVPVRERTMQIGDGVLIVHDRCSGNN